VGAMVIVDAWVGHLFIGQHAACVRWLSSMQGWAAYV
jgi:hypothetical protein